MLETPLAPAILGAWERGLAQGPVDRGLTLLALASPAQEPSALETVAVGERDRRLLRLREALFGPRLSGLASCPSCAERVELECAIAELCAPPPAGPLPALDLGGRELRLRLPDSRDLRAAAAADAGQAPAVLLERCLVAPDGTGVSAAQLSAELVAEAERRLAAADPQAEMRFALSCPACGTAWSAPFDVVPFLWAELDAWARRLFAEIHVLAAVYGWSEDAILGLGPARRAIYLELAAG